MVVARLKSRDEKETCGVVLVAGNESINTENKNLKNHLPLIQCI